MNDKHLENNQYSSLRTFNPNFILRDILQTYLFRYGTRGHVRLRMAVPDDINSFHTNISLKKKGTDQASYTDNYFLYNDNLDLFKSDIVERFSLSLERKYFLPTMSDRD